jgi:hypothetical protein
MKGCVRDRPKIRRLPREATTIQTTPLAKFNQTAKTSREFGEAERMSQIIVTHAPSDEARAEQVAQRLTKLGYSVSQSDGAPALSPRGRRQLETEISKAACVLVLWSRDAADEPALVTFAAHAKAKGKLALARLDQTPAPARIGSAVANLANWLGRKEARGWRALTSYLASKVRPAAAARKAASTPTPQRASAAPAPRASATPEKKKGGIGGLIMFLLLLLAGGAGAYYYFIVMQQSL